LSNCGGKRPHLRTAILFRDKASPFSFNTLLNADTFSCGGTGYANTPTEETVAFKRLLFLDDSLDIMIRLFEDASLEENLLEYLRWIDSEGNRIYNFDQ